MGNNNFDERQKLERGKAFQWAFLTAISLLGVLFIAEEVMEMYNFSMHFVFMSVFWISFSVFSTKAIFNDAFDGINSKTSKMLVIFYGIMGFLMLTIIVIEIFSNSFELNETSIASIINILSILETSTVFLIKQRKDKIAASEE